MKFISIYNFFINFIFHQFQMCTYKLKTHHFNAAIISSGENTSPGNGIRGRPKTSYNVQRSFDKLLFNATFQINKSDQNKKEETVFLTSFSPIFLAFCHFKISRLMRATCKKRSRLYQLTSYLSKFFLYKKYLITIIFPKVVETFVV